MTPHDFERVREIFHRACELNGPRRSDYVCEACGDRDDIRREVDELLALDAEGSAATVGAGIGDQLLDATRPVALENRMVGDFRIIRRHRPRLKMRSASMETVRLGRRM